MAEAVVEDRPGPAPRFYCHVCKQEFTDITQEYTCPVCSDGFIEELHDADPAPASNNMEVDVFELLNAGIRDGLSGATRGSGAWRTGARPSLLNHRHNPHHHHYHPGADPEPAPGMINAYDQLIRDFFAYVGAPAGAGGVRAPGRQFITTGGGGQGRADVTLTPMFLVGNPGDYVWGHDGLDSVITLMLNQLEPSGPPPMSAQKIDEIPKYEISAAELDKKMQCSVCLEDFQLQEQCRKLPCAHIFHETCILPWLELHGTCPICRDTFTEPGSADGAQEQDEAMDTDAPHQASTGTTASSFENFLSDIQRPGGVMEVLASHLPRALNPSRGGSSATAGVIGDAVPVAQRGSSSHRNNANSSHQSDSPSTSTTAATNSATQSSSSSGANANNNSNNLNFHLDDGLD